MEKQEQRKQERFIKREEEKGGEGGVCGPRPVSVDCECAFV